MKKDYNSFELKFPRDRKLIIVLESPRILRFLLRFFKLGIGKPYPFGKPHHFELNRKKDGKYYPPVNIEELL